MLVVYRGNFLPEVGPGTHDDGVKWSTECQIAWTLEAMGHQVVRAQEFDPKVAAPTPHPEWGWDRVVAEARQADLFLWTQTHNVDPEAGFAALARLRAGGVPSASFHLDLYWGLGRQPQIMEQPFWRTDFVFTADGGHAEGFARNGVNHHWMPPAVYGPDAVAGTPREEHRWPVIFVGSFPYPHPEHAEVRRLMILNLQSRFGTRFRHYRSGIRRKALGDLYASTTVVVGDSCLAGQVPYYWSERITETLGRRALLVHPYVPGLEEWYTDGVHLRTFQAGDMAQMITLVEHYLAHPDQAAVIAAAGQALVVERDTYEQRLEEVLAVVGLGARV